MDAASLETLWPYLLVVLIGVLPTEPWRIAAVLFSRGMRENSELLYWVKAVATTLLAGIVAKLVLGPSGALAGVPLALRIGAVVAGVVAFYLARRSVVVGVLVGEAVLIGLAWALPQL